MPIMVLQSVDLLYFAQQMEETHGPNKQMQYYMLWLSLLSIQIIALLGTQGTILKTTNGGTTWSPQSSGTSSDLFYVCFRLLLFKQ
jgi:hypothetical protein